MPSNSFDFLSKLAIVVLLAAFFIVSSFIRYAIKTVPEEKRIVVFRLGKCLGSRGPGNVVVLPLIDRAVWIDLQERTYRYNFEKLPIQDDAQASVAITLNGKVSNPENSVLNVPNMEKALWEAVDAEFKAIVVSKNSNELINLNGWIEGQLKDVLSRLSRPWGFDVTDIRVDDIRIM
jgi:regulator of protease activity HflC (stomatin/prohibitin superfamily)